MNDSPVPERKLGPKQKELIGLLVEGVLLIGMIVLMVRVWDAKHSTVTTKTVTVTKTLKPGATPTPLPAAIVRSMESLSVPIDSVAPGYVLSLQAPVAWRTVDIRSIVSGQDYASYNSNDLAAILRFVPDNPERNTLFPVNEPINTLDVLATSKWVTVNDGVLTPTNKQAYLTYLGSLKTVADITAKKCTPISMDGSVCSDAKVKPQIVQTADGSMSGMMYLNMQTQSASYDPSVVIELVGTVDGKSVHASGVFHLYDSLYSTLGGNGAQTNPNASDYVAKVQAARGAFTNGNPPADTMAMYDRVTEMVKSLRFSKK